jgi:cell division protein ZapA
MSSSNVTVTINGKDYPMACTPGDEEKIQVLGARIDEATRQVGAGAGTIGESRLLVMAALILVDQMNELESKLASAGDSNPAPADDGALADTIEQLATRLEKLTS